MATSYTGKITAPDWAEVETLTGVTFTSGKTYSMQVKNQCQLKVSDAIFDIENEKFNYTAGSDDLYIRTGGISCILTILEG